MSTPAMNSLYKEALTLTAKESKLAITHLLEVYSDNPEFETMMIGEEALPHSHIGKLVELRLVKLLERQINVAGKAALCQMPPPCKHGDTMLHVLVKSWKSIGLTTTIKLIRLCLKRAPELLTKTHLGGQFTPFQLAVELSAYGIIPVLLETNREQVNESYLTVGEYAIFNAIHLGSVHTVKTLLECGATVTYNGNYGTPVDMARTRAAEYKSMETLQIANLLEEQ